MVKLGSFSPVSVAAQKAGFAGRKQEHRKKTPSRARLI
jgi:hypothetical protein